MFAWTCQYHEQAFLICGKKRWGVCLEKLILGGLQQGRWSEASWRLCLDTGFVFEVSGSLSNLISKFLLLQVLLNLGKSWSDFDSASQMAKGFFLTKRKLWQRHFLQSARHYFCRFFLSTFSVNCGILTNMWRFHNHWEFALNWCRLHQALQREGIQMCVHWNEMMAWNSFNDPQTFLDPRKKIRPWWIALLFFLKKSRFQEHLTWVRDAWRTNKPCLAACCFNSSSVLPVGGTDRQVGWWHGQTGWNKKIRKYYFTWEKFALFLTYPLPQPKMKFSECDKLGKNHCPARSDAHWIIKRFRWSSQKYQTRNLASRSQK